MPRILALLFLIWALPLSVAHGQTASAPSNDVLTCSPAPCVLNPVQATSGTYSVFDGAIAVDPANPKNMLIGTLDDNCPFSPLGFYVSADGGSTWSQTTCLDDIITSKGRGVYYPTGQPMVAYDLTGNAYIAGEYIDSMFVGFGLVAFEKSKDGVNWSQQQLALSRGFYDVLNSWMMSDTNPQSPYAGSLYVSTITIKEQLGKDEQIVVSHSNDGGQHWKLVTVTPTEVYPAIDRYTNMTVGKDGTIYVTWTYCPKNGPDSNCQIGTAYTVFSKSSDGGDTWSTPTLISTFSYGDCNCHSAEIPNTNPHVFVPSYSAIGVDNSSGPYAGNLYVSMFNWTGTQLQVVVVRSTDGGSTWSAPVPVAPSSDTHDQFLPWLSVSSTGLVGVSWLDRRNDPNNVDYQAFATISTDGGKTFPTNAPLTSKLSNPNLNGNDYLGDYAGNTWVGSTFLAVWPDTSNGVNVQDVIGGIRLH